MLLPVQLFKGFTHLIYPHLCMGCGTDLLDPVSQLCLRCIHELPVTNYELHRNNPVEKRFYGRLDIVSATAQYYFTKSSLLSTLVHQVKYKGNKELGRQLGLLMGYSLQQANLKADLIIPLPLHSSRLRKRGYNQSALLAEGMSSITGITVRADLVERISNTASQTKRSRIERWKNMEGQFRVKKTDPLKNKHILLVDDVVTTGATLEACGAEILKVQGTTLSIACLCHTFN